jgi:signal peptide peptidase SppA
MKTKLFRSNLSRGAVLAFDPRALDVEFDIQEAKENEQRESIAIVSVCGPLEHHKSNIWDSYDSIVERIESAFANEDVACVVMCIDSPGGDAAGCTEAHRNIRRLRKKYDKPLYAYSNESMYSAAYAIGSAADEIWVPETGGVGSVGVICALLDKTKYNEKAGLNIKLLTTGARKADSQADRVLTDDVVNVMQERVDYLGDVFFKTVAKARSMSPKAVEKLQAGVFLGQSAVDSGLADNVGGWYKFILYVSEQIGSTENVADPELISQNSESAKEHAKMTLAELRKAKELAAKKLATAKASERTKLFAAYEKAATAVADFQAKTKYVKKTEEKLEKDDDEEEDDDNSDDEDEDSDAEEEEESEEEESSDDDESESEEESEEEEESSKSKASKKAKKAAASMSLASVERMYSLVSNLTGKKDVSEVLGALEGMTPRVKAMPKAEQRLARLENDSLKSRVKSMLDVAMKEGRVTPAQAKGLEPQGMKDHKWLKGYLSAQPKSLMREEEHIADISAPNQTLDMQGLNTDQQKMLQQSANSAGMSVEDYTKDIMKHTKPNGASARKF